MERRFAIFLWKLFHMGAIHHTLIENTRTCLLNLPCAATVWKVTNDAFSSKNHACHLWIRTAWGRKWFAVTPCKTKLVKLLRSPFSPLFQTGNSKIYTLIKRHTPGTSQLYSHGCAQWTPRRIAAGQWEQVKPKALSIPVTTSLCVMSSGWGELTVSVHMSQFICLCVQERMDVCISGTFVCTDIVCTGTLVSFFFLFFSLCIAATCKLWQVCVKSL